MSTTDSSPSPPANNDQILSESPSSPTSRMSSKPETGSPSGSPQSTSRLPSLRTRPDQVAGAGMTNSSTPLGNINAARRPTLPQSPAGSRAGQLPEDVQAKMKAFHLSRQGAPQAAAGRSMSGAMRGPPPMASPVSTSPSTNPMGGAPSLVGSPGGFRLPPGGPPAPVPFKPGSSTPNLTLNPKMGLAAKRGLGKGMKLTDATGPTSATPTSATSSDPSSASDGGADSATGGGQSLFNKYSEFVDTKTGTLKFEGKATVHGKGIDFSSGTSFSISLDEVDTLDELGKGNYGTVYKVRHSRPQLRKPGTGLAGNRVAPSQIAANGLSDCKVDSSQPSKSTGVVMAMKEIRLELDEAKFAAIIMELDILHRCLSPYIVDFYGAFFQEGAVYICMEFMDGGSIDKLYGDGVPESVLQKITYATVMGLKTLKDEHNIIHRDVKPTNILIGSNGLIKICDFGVSGNLVASIAKTNIGCQSYMAPERISGGGVAQAGANPGGGTYSVQSDIWSLGLTIIECAMGQYPYPPETYDNIFSQLSAIVDGDPPDLPSHFSETARDFVHKALNKVPKLRPTYAMLLRHPWLLPQTKPTTITEEDEEEAAAAAAESPADAGNATVPPVEAEEDRMADPEVGQWVRDALARKRSGKLGSKAKPALHAAPLDAARTGVTPPDGQSALLSS